MAIIRIDQNNIDNEHICCAIGNDKENKGRAQSKKDWLKTQFSKGLVFKRLNERGKVFIEYMPIENVWKPIIGTNYLVINCLWVSGQFKGQGYSKLLLDECISDAKNQKKDGIAVITSTKSKPFLTDKKFYENQGFTAVDTAIPYFELLALVLKKAGTVPRFTEKSRLGVSGKKRGFTFIYSNQCAFMEEYVQLLSKVATESKFQSSIMKIISSEDAKKNGSPFGSLGIYYNGRFITHELMTEDKFHKLIKEKCV